MSKYTYLTTSLHSIANWYNNFQDSVLKLKLLLGKIQRKDQHLKTDSECALFLCTTSIISLFPHSTTTSKWFKPKIQCIFTVTCTRNAEYNSNTLSTTTFSEYTGMTRWPFLPNSKHKGIILHNFILLCTPVTTHHLCCRFLTCRWTLGQYSTGGRMPGQTNT